MCIKHFGLVTELTFPVGENDPVLHVIDADGIATGDLFIMCTGLCAVIGSPELAFSPWSYTAAGGGLFGLLFYLITPSVIDTCQRFLDWWESRLKKVPTQDIILVVIGMIITLLLGLLISYPIYNIPHVGAYIAPLITLGLVFLECFILSRKEEFFSYFF